MDEALGEAFSGVLVSDCYAAYHHYDGPKQRCWAHPCSSRGQALLRDIHDQRTRYPKAAPLAVQAKLCRRIERHIKSLPRTGYGELFVFVAEPDVPADNNPAERSLRHLVISRKVSGGTRSEQGTERKMTLASIFGAWRAQGLNPLAACRQLLVSPLL